MQQIAYPAKENLHVNACSICIILEIEDQSYVWRDVLCVSSVVVLSCRCDLTCELASYWLHNSSRRLSRLPGEDPRHQRQLSDPGGRLVQPRHRSRAAGRPTHRAQRHRRRLYRQRRNHLRQNVIRWRVRWMPFSHVNNCNNTLHLRHLKITSSYAKKLEK